MDRPRNYRAGISEITGFLRDLIPKFTRIGECHILSSEGDGSDEESLVIVNQWIEEYKGDRRKAEYAMNHFHICLFAEQAEGDYSPEDLQIIASVYVALLKEGLASAFSDQEFDVITVGEDILEEDPEEFFVTFCRREKRS